MLEDKLEELKKVGNYSVQLSYGEGVGCDDIDVPKNERIIVITAFMVGYLGELRVMWKGTLPELEIFSFGLSSPVIISNPPKKQEFEKNGYYLWGTKGALERYRPNG